MTHLPLRSFRLVCKPEERPFVVALLEAQGFRFTPEPFSEHAMALQHEPFPLGASIAATFGYIYIQDRSSMLPPVALNPGKASAVLDMCASPGSKTGFLGQLTGPSGFVAGNEPSRNRLATLRKNMQTLNLLQCATLSFSGESLPLPSSGAFVNNTLFSNNVIRKSPANIPHPILPLSPIYEGWPFIQLDPPCSGWGTVEKNPQVMRLWQGDKVKPLIALQRKLLQEAFRLLKPGGRLVYSTCTTNSAENEEQIRFAVEEVGLRFVPLPSLPGFSFEDSTIPEYSGCLRVATGEHGQGFFVAAFEKDASASIPFPTTSRAEETTTKARAGKTQKAPAVLQVLPASALEGECISPKLLPTGTIMDVNGVAHFLPEASRVLIPEGIPWKGFVLGKTDAGGTVRVSPGIRALMLSRQQAEKSGAAHISVDDPAVITRLLTGQSLEVSVKAREIGLYFNELPLCRLVVKGKRALLPPLF